MCCNKSFNMLMIILTLLPRISYQGLHVSFCSEEQPYWSQNPDSHCFTCWERFHIDTSVETQNAEFSYKSCLYLYSLAYQYLQFREAITEYQTEQKQKYLSHLPHKSCEIFDVSSCIENQKATTLLFISLNFGCPFYPTGLSLLRRKKLQQA